MNGNRSAYVKSPWQFEVRDLPVADPGPGQMLVQIAACAVCGTDLHTADRRAADWMPFGHEVSGIVKAVGDGVTRFKEGDRVALDSSAPCGKCDTCLPQPYGRGRPDLCRTVATYWGKGAMGFSEMILTPHECAVRVPESVPLDVAALTEPMGVSIDLVETAEIGPGDHVLVIGPGPLGLGAMVAAKRAGAARVILAGRSGSVARMKAGAALGADEIIEVDKTSVAGYDFGSRSPNKILATSPPQTLLDAIEIAAFGAVIAYIGIAFGPESVIELDADAFHFKKLSLRASHASPGTQAAKSIRLLACVPELGRELISHRFKLDEIGQAMLTLRDDKAASVKGVMVNA